MVLDKKGGRGKGEELGNKEADELLRGYDKLKKS